MKLSDYRGMWLEIVELYSWNIVKNGLLSAGSIVCLKYFIEKKLVAFALAVWSCNQTWGESLLQD